MIAYCSRWAVLVMLLCAANSAFAQTFPSRPITLYLPFIPGPTDSMARKFTEVAARHLGQPIVVENKPGAGGTLAPALMSRTAKPDGYTLTIMSSSLFRYPYILQRLHEAFSKAFDDPELLKVLDMLKKDPWPMTPAAYTAWAKESYRLERAMVERAGMMAK